MNPNSDPFAEERRLIIALNRLFKSIHVLWVERKVVVSYLVFALIIGVSFALGSQKEYQAKTRILPYRGGLSGSGGLSGLAGLAGIRVPISAGDQTIPAELYPEVAQSQDFRIQLALTPIYFGSLDRRVTPVEYFGKIHRGSFVSRLREPDAELLTKSSAVDTTLKPIGSSPGASILPDEYGPGFLSLVGALSHRITVTIDKKTSIITITGRMPDSHAAADLVRLASSQLMTKIIDYDSKKASEQFRFVSEQYKVASQRYEQAQKNLAVFTDRNRSLVSATAQVERDRLQREFDLAYEFYQQFGREVEQARIKMNQDTPVFAVLEKPIVPTSHVTPKRRQIVALALLFGLVAAVGRIFSRRLLKAGVTEPFLSLP